MPMEEGRALTDYEQSLLREVERLKLVLKLQDRHLADMRKIALGTVGTVHLDDEDSVLMERATMTHGSIGEQPRPLSIVDEVAALRRMGTPAEQAYLEERHMANPAGAVAPPEPPGLARTTRRGGVVGFTNL